MDTEQQMKLALYGVRGSLPVSSAETIRYGGNTSCLAIRGSDGSLLIVDAGTGIHKLGRQLPAVGECSLLLSHTHWDHIMGLPFFEPLYSPDWTVHLYVPSGAVGILAMLFDGVHFPQHAHSLKAQVRVLEYQTGATLQIGALQIQNFDMPHPGKSVGLRIHDGWTLVLSNDCEIIPRPAVLHSLLQGADVAIVDGQYNREEYAIHAGWGHSYREAWMQPALDAGVRRLLFTHHDPNSTDEQLDHESRALHEAYAASALRFEMAREGTVIEHFSVRAGL